MKKCFCTLVLLLLAAPAGAATWLVTDPAGDLATANSLGWCIEAANLSPGPDRIVFNIPSAAGGPVTILPEQTYVIRDDFTTIDGTTQPGASPNTNPAPQPLNTMLMVEIDGSQIQNGVAVFRMEANLGLIRGLAINSGPVFEITIGWQNSGLVGNHIAGNFIGTDIPGLLAKPSGWMGFNPPYAVGVYVLNGATLTYIGCNDDGEDEAAERNLISGEAHNDWMAGHGVVLQSRSGAVVENYVFGNLIGTNAGVDAPLGNNYGVTLLGGSENNTVRENVIAGNNLDGIFGASVLGPAGQMVINNHFYTNYVGMDPNVQAALPNGRDGIHLESGCHRNEFGSTGWPTPAGGAESGNVISGNARHGVAITGTNSGSVSGSATSNTFQFNFVGLDAAGGAAIANAEHGFYLEQTGGGNFIGDGADGNLVSGNGLHGIVLRRSSTNGVVSNFIGVNLAGVQVPNGRDGIRLECNDVGCSELNDIESNLILGNGGNGIGLWGAHLDNTIGPDNVIEQNQQSGIFSVIADDSNQVVLNIVQLNDFHGVYLKGSSLELIENQVLENAGWGIVAVPDFAVDTSPSSAGDDQLATPMITGNTIDHNTGGGIFSQDTEPVNGRTLHLDNTIGDNNGEHDVLQMYYGAVEILDDALNPITSGAYTVTVEDALGFAEIGDQTDGGLWGRPGFVHTDISSWFVLVSYEVDTAGNFHDGSPHTVRIAGPYVGSDSYTFDGINNDVDHGGTWGAGITTGSLFRYQVADVVCELDSDLDGVPDASDCAPSDPAYQGSAGVPCDADGDGYCDDNITGVVRQADCPQDVCTAGLCTPSDCDDGDANVNPGQVEEAFGDAACSDGVDNDCDGDVDDDDPGCWECTNDADCDDGDVCNGAESCVAGFCQSGAALDCNDGDPCTSDSCDPTAGCQYSYNTAPCDDGAWCPVGDTCDGAGSCVGTARDCSGAGDQCNTGVCNEEADACVAQPVEDGVSCDDGAWCTLDDVCTAGVCGGAARDCGAAGDQCNTGVCDEVSDACVPDPVGDGTACDDGAWCTVDDACTAGTCGGAARDCSASADQCNAGVCNEETDSCEAEPLSDLTPCDDGLYCTVDDACASGVCSGTARDCSTAGDQCNDGVCDEDAGQCVADPLDDGTTCDDGDACTVSDVCSDGVCGGALIDDDGDGVPPESCGGDDCDDGNAAIHPGAEETCGDGIDQDCNGEDLQCGCEDADGDGFEDASCGGSDCDDGNAEVNPDAMEVCDDDVDNDCDGDTDLADADCAGCVDADGDGYEDEACGGDDCDDDDAGIHPGADEVCGDGVDQDCNGEDLQCGCEDSDGDGFEDASCGGTDCDDDDAEVNPDADEVCNDMIDNDCDGDTDMDDADCAGCVDADGDGFEDEACGGDDCDDDDAGIHPGADEVCGDGVDQDCNGEDLQCGCADADEDGYQDASCGGYDCDDGDAGVNPDADEVCDDGVDNDCDGDTDGDDSDCAGCADADNDGFEDEACGGTDCDDDDPEVNPDAVELCEDGIDNDCDGATDDNDDDCSRGAAGGCGCGGTGRGAAAPGLLLILLLGLALRRVGRSC